MAQKTAAEKRKPVLRTNHAADILDGGGANEQEQIRTRLFGLVVDGKEMALAAQVAKLEKAGVDIKPVINAKYEVGFTLLMHAAKRGLVHACELLAEKGADVNATNGFGWTASMVAEHYGYKETAAFLKSKELQPAEKSA